MNEQLQKRHLELEILMCHRGVGVVMIREHVLQLLTFMALLDLRVHSVMTSVAFYDPRELITTQSKKRRYR